MHCLASMPCGAIIKKRKWPDGNDLELLVPQ